MPIFASLGAGSSRATGGIGIASKTVPGQPTIGTATATGQNSATVSFTAPASNGGATITQYIATASPGGATGTLNQAGSGTITVNGLSPATQYTFTVKAVNSVGQSLASTSSNQITTAAATPTSVEYLVVAGGGKAGNGAWPAFETGGGGAGGLLTGSIGVVGSTAYSITVGGGGSGSTFSSINTTAGGISGTADRNTTGGQDGGNGGSGGGGQFGRNNDGSQITVGGKGIYPGSSYISATRQGYDGGNGASSAGGGGGGAGGQGATATNYTGGAGGVGLQSSITGTATYYAGGGGGGGSNSAASGGAGGGANGRVGAPGYDGTPNTGGGGGGQTQENGSGGNGGSGVVIIAYPNTYAVLTSISGGLTYDQPTRSGYRVYRFTAGTGNISW